MAVPGMHCFMYEMECTKGFAELREQTNKIKTARPIQELCFEKAKIEKDVEKNEKQID